MSEEDNVKMGRTSDNEEDEATIQTPPRKLIRLRLQNLDSEAVLGGCCSSEQGAAPGSSTPRTAADCNRYDSNSDDDAEAMISGSEEEEENDENSSSSSSEEEDGNSCAFWKFGCMQRFVNVLDLKEHVQKGCKYSILNNCREEQCRGTATGRFQTLDKLVEHTIQQHHVVPNVLEADGAFSFSVNRDFFDSPERGVNDVNAKIVGHAQIDNSGEKYGVAFFFISSWKGVNDKKVYLVPVLHSKEEVMDHWVQVKCCVRGSKVDNITPLTRMKVPRLNIAMCEAVGRAERFFHGMETLDVVSYEKEAFLQNGRYGSNGTLEYYLLVSLESYRVRIMRGSGLEPRKYAQNIEHLQLDEAVEMNLVNSLSELVVNAQVLIPQLHGGADLIIEGHDEARLFNTFSAALSSYAIKTRDKNSTGPKKCTGILIFPTLTLLNTAEVAWKEKGAEYGVLVSSLHTDREVILKKLQLHGTDILLTTPSALIRALEKKKDLLSDGLVSMLNFVVVFDADYFMERSCSRNALRECMGKIEGSVNKNLVRVAISPVVNQKLVTFLYSHGFSFFCNIFSVGVAPDAVIKKLEMEVKHTKLITFKRPMLLEILSKHDHESTGRWIIFAVENPIKCPGHVRTLVDYLTTIYGNRISHVQSEAEMELNPNAFDPFVANPKGILVTGYFALQRLDKINIGAHVLMHTLPSSKADLRRVADLFLENEDRKVGLKCYGLKDRYSQNHSIDVDFFIQG